MPSMTSKPTRYGVSAGPGRAVRSPSMRWRTAGCSEGCTPASQADRSVRGCESLFSAVASEAVAVR